MTIAGSPYLNRPLRDLVSPGDTRRRCTRCGWPLTYLDPLCCVCKWIAAGRPPPQNSWPMVCRFPADAMANGIDGSHRFDQYETDYD